MTAGFVVGVDAGGTATRALAVDESGEVLGFATASGGNPNSCPPSRAAEAIGSAIAGASAGLAASDLRACVVGLAGRSKLTDPTVAAIFQRAMADLPVSPAVVSDADAAFASATAQPDGTVLVAGTGSIAARIRDRRTVATVGGYGWLLGDEGSGFWLGREAVRATLDGLAHGCLGALGHAVLSSAAVHPEDPHAANRLITEVNGQPPVRLDRFAPLVSRAHAEGDPVALAIVKRAAGLLMDTAIAARDEGERTPVVLAGSVLGVGSPVGTLVREGLAKWHPLSSGDGALGAAWLAAVRAFGDGAARPRRVP
ncbi:N-acetylglucosamine kinase-like BadF-type ATPase [Saccharomonospora amisosensis]|uniref:N-acetylglucosamine kinase-like BadF-type ATPase n=1 Tax=Saccharomonospora amisosensis TaxID=1128677 RepID=A0A7X5ULJ7_9PSEU|nr:BadF/BadG/BcrA/BcrD ATPase family protein [Saccharomonospora amisosensis]NIJ10247.1 N-acetylglucosamine kinase-like BadF-type ATPase [Saccharomonospora amisosensis]